MDLDTSDAADKPDGARHGCGRAGARNGRIVIRAEAQVPLPTTFVVATMLSEQITPATESEVVAP
jgi:hypothetical protein